MHRSFVATTGLKLTRSPSPRVQAARRRLVLVGALLALAGAGAVIGAMTAPMRAADGPFGPQSYFPSQ